MSRPEDALCLQIRAAGLPEPVREYRFAPPRRFRFDAAYPDRMIAIEVEGGVWTGGRHVRGSGYSADCEKYSIAAILGWRVLRVTTGQVDSGQALAWIEQALGGGGC